MNHKLHTPGDSELRAQDKRDNVPPWAERQGPACSRNSGHLAAASACGFRPRSGGEYPPHRRRGQAVLRRGDHCHYGLSAPPLSGGSRPGPGRWPEHHRSLRGCTDQSAQRPTTPENVQRPTSGSSRASPAWTTPMRRYPGAGTRARCQPARGRSWPTRSSPTSRPRENSVGIRDWGLEGGAKGPVAETLALSQSEFPPPFFILQIGGHRLDSQKRLRLVIQGRAARIGPKHFAFQAWVPSRGQEGSCFFRRAAKEPSFKYFRLHLNLTVRPAVLPVKREGVRTMATALATPADPGQGRAGPGSPFLRAAQTGGRGVLREILVLSGVVQLLPQAGGPRGGTGSRPAKTRI